MGSLRRDSKASERFCYLSIVNEIWGLMIPDDDWNERVVVASHGGKGDMGEESPSEPRGLLATHIIVGG